MQFSHGFFIRQRKNPTKLRFFTQSLLDIEIKLLLSNKKAHPSVKDVLFRLIKADLLTFC
tara:strand:- start:441 stop:620 length:180 start_codon:yes stop_codon:yes gene_type:complete